MSSPHSSLRRLTIVICGASGQPVVLTAAFPVSSRHPGGAGAESRGLPRGRAAGHWRSPGEATRPRRRLRRGGAAPFGVPLSATSSPTGPAPASPPTPLRSRAAPATPARRVVWRGPATPSRGHRVHQGARHPRSPGRHRPRVPRTGRRASRAMASRGHARLATATGRLRPVYAQPLPASAGARAAGPRARRRAYGGAASGGRASVRRNRARVPRRTNQSYSDGDKSESLMQAQALLAPSRREQAARWCTRPGLQITLTRVGRSRSRGDSGCVADCADTSVLGSRASGSSSGWRRPC